MLYAYSNNGHSMRCIGETTELLPGEVAFAHQPTAEELAAQFPQYEEQEEREAALRRIYELEGEITPRRLRDAVLTEAGREWLVEQELQIAIVRSQL